MADMLKLIDDCELNENDFKLLEMIEEARGCYHLSCESGCPIFKVKGGKEIRCGRFLEGLGFEDSHKSAGMVASLILARHESKDFWRL